jgi:hypothetical protein
MLICSRYHHAPFSFRRILEISHIYAVLRSSLDAFARIKPAQIVKIRAIDDAMNASDVAARDGIPFKVGQKVRLIKSLLSDIVCVVKELMTMRADLWSKEHCSGAA